MLRLDFTEEELKQIKSKIRFSERQERIIEYRRRDYSITQMAMLEPCSESTINREMKKIKKKITKVL